MPKQLDSHGTRRVAATTHVAGSTTLRDCRESRSRSDADQYNITGVRQNSTLSQYLALDGIYHLLWAAFPNNPTPRLRLVMPLKPSSTGFSPSLTPFSKGLEAGSEEHTTILTNIPGPIADDAKTPQFLITNLDYDSYVGQIAIGRLNNGTLEMNKRYSLCGEEKITSGHKFSALYTFKG